jgi:transcription initiation factor TFIIIB Brf1 subunit/transcription initiation factor TFIIB
MSDSFDLFDQLTETDLIFVDSHEKGTGLNINVHSDIFDSDGEDFEEDLGETHTDISTLKHTEDECPHTDSVQDKNVVVCINCGKCIQKLFNQHREWKSQQTRVTVDDKNIFKDVENIQFSENVVQIANSLYVQVTRDKIYRGNARKGIISACIFYAFKVIGKPQIYKKIIKLFNINKKIGLKGLKFVSINAPKNSVIFKTQITPLTYIEYYMNELQASTDDIQQIKELYKFIESKQIQKLNRSRPQSVASGIVYFWLLRENRKITLKTFSKITELSELTIVKIQKDIKEILDQQP